MLEATHAAVDTAASKTAAMVGEVVHCLHDFKQTASGGQAAPHDPGQLNFKGLFTRDRQPKPTAQCIRRRYQELMERMERPTQRERPHQQ